MNELIEEVMSSNRVADATGKEYELHSNISRAEGEFLHKLVLGNAVTRSIEVGCGYGISSLYICSALAQKGVGTHVIVDPYQSSQWHGIGVQNLTRSGFTAFTLIEKPSEIALPELLRDGKVFDFAFIDGWHTFDHALVDFFYVNRLLANGGIVAFDDVDYPAVRKLMRYVSRYPNYRVIDSVHFPTNRLARLRSAGSHVVSRLVNALPTRMRLLFDDTVLRPDTSLNLNTSMLALRKTGDDERSWDWYARF